MASPTIEQRDAMPALTTTFVPPAQCTEGRLTMLARQEFYVWQNAPIPVVGTTRGECYPKEFMNSYIAGFGGNTQPAFSPLVCPQNYRTISSQDLGSQPYIICCPNNYGFAPPRNPDRNRPGGGGTCYSDIISTTVTKYDINTYSGLIFFSTSGQAYAHPFDGFAYQGRQVATAIPSNPIPIPVQTSESAGKALPTTPTRDDPIPQPSIAPASPSTTISSARQQTPYALPESTSTLSSSVIALTTVGSSMTVYSTIPPSVIIIYNSIGDSATSLITSTATAIPVSNTPSMTGSQIAGMTIGIIAAVLLLALLVFFALRWKHKTRKPLELQHNDAYILKKPIIEDHPSNRSSNKSHPEEKFNYVVVESPLDPKDHHEIGDVSRRSFIQSPTANEEASELSTHEMDGVPRTLQSMPTRMNGVEGHDRWMDMTTVSTFSPNRP